MESPRGRCWACGKEDVTTCPKCDLAWYCSEECQQKDRVRHFEECISATKREQLCSFCGKILDERALTCNICRAVFYCNQDCKRPHSDIHSTVCGYTKEKILQMSQTIQKWNRKIKNTPQYIGRLVHAMDFLRWSENEGKTNCSYHGPVSLMIFGADLKHILFTLSQLPEDFQSAVTFTMLDASPHLLSRNILLLFLLRKAFERSSQTEELIRRTLFIYYSLRLDFASFFFLCKSLETFRAWTYSRFSEEMQNMVNVSQETFFQIQSIWNGWLTFSRVPDVLKKLEKTRNLKLRRPEVQRIVERVKQVISKELESDFCHWFLQGSFKLKDKNVYGNVTLACFNPFHKDYQEMYSDIDPPSCDDSTQLKLETEDDIMIYSPYGTDLIFQDWDYYEISKGQLKKENVLEIYQDYIKTIMKRAGEFLVFKKVKINFELTKPSDSTMEASVPNGTYDRICTGLLADIIGLPKLLNMTSPFLNNNNPRACVITHHRLWSTFIEMKNMAALKKEWLCNNSLQAPIDPHTTVATKWATFRQFLQAELLCYRRASDYSRAKCDHIPSLNEVSEMNGLQMSDFLFDANSIFPFRFRVNKRYISMTDNKLYTLEWKSIPMTLPRQEETFPRCKENDNNYGIFKPTLNLSESSEVDLDLQSGKEVLGEKPTCFGFEGTGGNNFNSLTSKEKGPLITCKNPFQTVNPLVVTGRINGAQKLVNQLDKTSPSVPSKSYNHNKPNQANKINANNILNDSSDQERSHLRSSSTEDKKLVKSLISTFSKQELPKLCNTASLKHRTPPSKSNKETINADVHGNQSKKDTFDNSRLKIFKRNQDLKRNFLRQSFPQPSYNKEGTKLSSSNATTCQGSWHDSLTKSKTKTIINSSNKSLNFNEFEETKRCSAYRGQSSKFPGNASVQIPNTAHQIETLICAFEKSVNTSLSSNKSPQNPEYLVCSQIPLKNQRLSPNNLLDDSKESYPSINKSKSMTEMHHNSEFKTDMGTYKSDPKLFEHIVDSNVETKTLIRDKIPKFNSSTLDLKSTSKLVEEKSPREFRSNIKKKTATSGQMKMVELKDKSEFSNQIKVDVNLVTDFEVKQNRNNEFQLGSVSSVRTHTGSLRGEAKMQPSKLRGIHTTEINFKPRPNSYPMVKINGTPNMINVQGHSAAYNLDKKDAVPKLQKRVIDIANYYEKRINALQLSTFDSHDSKYSKTITDSSNANDGKTRFSERKSGFNDDCKSKANFSKFNPLASDLKKLNFATIASAKIMNLKTVPMDRSVHEVRKQSQQSNRENKNPEWNLKRDYLNLEDLENVVNCEIASNDAESYENTSFQNMSTLNQVSASTVVSPHSCIKQKNSNTPEGALNPESRVCQLDLSDNGKNLILENNKPSSLIRNSSLKYTNKLFWKPKMNVSELPVSKDLTKPVKGKNSFDYVFASSCDDQKAKQIKLEKYQAHLGSAARLNLTNKPMIGTPSVEEGTANEEANYDTENDSGIEQSEIEIDEAIEAVEAFEIEGSQDSTVLGKKSRDETVETHIKVKKKGLPSFLDESKDGDDVRDISAFKTDEEVNLTSQNLPSKIETETSKAKLKNLFDTILGRNTYSSSNSKSHVSGFHKEQIFELSARECPKPSFSIDEVNKEQNENFEISAKSLGIPSVLKRDGSRKSERKALRVSWGDLPHSSSDYSLRSSNEQDKTKDANVDEEEGESQDEDEEVRSFEDEEKKLLYFLESFEGDDDLDFKASSL